MFKWKAISKWFLLWFVFGLPLTSLMQTVCRESRRWSSRPISFCGECILSLWAGASLPPPTVILYEFRRLKSKSQDPLWDPATSVIQKRGQPWNPLLHRNPWLDNAVASTMEHKVPANKHAVDMPWWIPSSTQCPPGNHIFKLTHLHAPATAKCPPSQWTRH